MHNIINVPIQPMWRNPQLTPSGFSFDNAAKDKTETPTPAAAANAKGDTAGEEVNFVLARLFVLVVPPCYDFTLFV